MKTWQEINKNKELKPGDRVRLWFSSTSSIWIAATQQYLVERKLAKEPRIFLRSVGQRKQDGKDFLVFDIEIVQPPELDPFSNVQTASIDPITVLALVALVLVSIVLVDVSFDHAEQLIEKIEESPAVQVATASVGIGIVLAAIAVVLWLWNKR